MPPEKSYSLPARVRIATEADAPAILRLLKTAPYNHVHVDWNVPVDWLGTPGFVVQQYAQTDSPHQPSLVTQLLGPQRGLKACLAVAADPPPAAWVRVACVASGIERPIEALGFMLVKVVDYLRELGVTELGWLAANGWPEEWLIELGFQKSNHIETYVKGDLDLPIIVESEALMIRQARPADMPKLAKIEAAAFAPIWRHSVDGLSLALYQASSFDVAILNESIVGFQLSSISGDIAHLVRLTVDPSFQRQGVGSALLHQAIEEYRTKGVRLITLNTQVDNVASQLLYRKFGFDASGQRSPLWSLPI